MALLMKIFFLQFFPATLSSPSWTLSSVQWPFELTRCPSRALNSPRGLLPEIERKKDTVRSAAFGRGGPRTPSTATDANHDCAFVENAFFALILDGEMSTE